MASLIAIGGAEEVFKITSKTGIVFPEIQSLSKYLAEICTASRYVCLPPTQRFIMLSKEGLTSRESILLSFPLISTQVFLGLKFMAAAMWLDSGHSVERRFPRDNVCVFQYGCIYHAYPGAPRTQTFQF